MSTLSTVTRRGAAVAATALLVLTAPLPGAGAADPLDPTAHAPSSEPADAAFGLDTAAAPGTIVVDEQESPIAPGLTLTEFEHLDARGWLRGDVLTADLRTDGLRVDYTDPGAVAEGSPLSEQLAGTGAVAGVNGDFFDINNTTAPLGIGISRDEGLLTAPVAGHHQAATIDADGVGRLSEVFLEGTATTPAGDLVLAGVNTHLLPAGGVGLFTPRWGTASRARALDGAAGTEVLLRDGVVRSVRDGAGEGVIAPGDTVLVGREAGAEALAGLGVGDAVEVGYRARADVDEIAVAIGGNAVLVRDGEPVPHDDTATAPRTAVGFADDGTTMWLVTVDGRQADSRGMTLDELARFMDRLGAEEALNLDGGGSSTMLARELGSDGLGVRNAPSDGEQRAVPNGLALFSAPGSGAVSGLAVAPALDLDGADRVFPGLRRTVTAAGHDESLAPVEATPRWRSDNPVAAVLSSGAGATATVTGRRPGDLEVLASVGSVRSAMPLTVLSDLHRIDTGQPRVAVADGDTTVPLTVTGYDADGFSAPIEAADVTVTGGEDVVQVRPGEDATFTLHPLVDSGSAVLELAVDGSTTSVAVTIGLEERVVADFADADTWRFTAARSTGSVSPADGREDDTGLELAYDYTQSTATRNAYARPPQTIQLPGQPQRISLWVQGQGRGEWTAFSITDGDGTFVPMYGPYITWTGWQKVDLAIPEGVTYPLTFTGFATLETGAGRQYTGSVRIDDLAVQVAPDVEVPEVPRAQDAVVVTDGTVEEREQQVAVVSDVQFVAANGPDSDLVQAARRTLREVVASDPDLVVINGDLVDTAYPEDFALAREVLDSELGDDVPWHYVPGNHEIAGPGSIDNFVAEFGDPTSTFDVDGTRFVLLNSAFGSFRAGGFDQLLMLEEALDTAVDDDAVSGVVVMAHHPTNDPSPSAASQLGDRLEAGLLERWLADFEAEADKSAAYVSSHAGRFSAESVDGVPYLVTGNAGKSPSGTPATGGFTGWTMLGIDPDEGNTPDRGRVRLPVGGTVQERTAWLQSETRPSVEDLVLTAPSTVAVGADASVTASVLQEGREVPVAWPVSADWSGSAGLRIGSAPAVGDRRVVASLDPASGELVAHRAGTVEVRVTVNGVTEEATITVS